MDDFQLQSTDRARVDAAYGFSVPDAYLKLLARLAEPDGSVAGGEGSLFQAVTGLLLADPGRADPGTPPELFLLGRTGMDGVTCGCVVHDARLSHEPPLAMFNPLECRADYLGVDTRRSLGVMMGMSLAQLPADSPHRRQVRSIIEIMGFDPDDLPSESLLGVRPRTPPGWRLAMTADGLGVAAEARLFEAGQVFDEDPEDFDCQELGAYTRSAEAALDAGFPATALWLLRNGFTFWAAQGMPGELVTLLRQTYTRLGRSQLVARLDLAVAASRRG